MKVAVVPERSKTRGKIVFEFVRERRLCFLFQDGKVSDRCIGHSYGINGQWESYPTRARKPSNKTSNNVSDKNSL